MSVDCGRNFLQLYKDCLWLASNFIALLLSQHPGHLVDIFTLFFSFPFNRDSPRKKLHPPLYFTKLFPSLLLNATQFWRKIRRDRFIFTKIMWSPRSRRNKKKKKGDLWLCYSNYFFTDNVGLLNHITGQFLFFGHIYIVFHKFLSVTRAIF